MEEFSGTGGQLDFGIMAFSLSISKKINKCVELTFIGSFAIKLRFIQSIKKWIALQRPLLHCIYRVERKKTPSKHVVL